MQIVGPPKADPEYANQVMATLARMAAQEANPIRQVLIQGRVADGAAVYDKCCWILSRIESPIEQRLIFALNYEVFLALDVQIGLSGYRADFGFPDLQLAVECDGHEFHKTKEQRKHDAKRDRVFTHAGWNVIRFTGTEIHANARECAAEIERIYEAAKQERFPAVPSDQGASTVQTAE